MTSDLFRVCCEREFACFLWIYLILRRNVNKFLVADVLLSCFRTCRLQLLNKRNVVGLQCYRTRDIQERSRAGYVAQVGGCTKVCSFVYLFHCIKRQQPIPIR